MTACFSCSRWSFQVINHPLTACVPASPLQPSEGTEMPVRVSHKLDDVMVAVTGLIGVFQVSMISLSLNSLLPSDAIYGGIELGQHWLRQWLVASRHQAISQCWLIISEVLWQLPEGNFQNIPQLSITKISLRISHLNCHSNLSGDNELTLYMPNWLEET